MGKKDYKNKNVIITGAGGFLGSHLLGMIKATGYKNVFGPSIEEYDLTKESAIVEMYKKIKPQVIIHLAARVGGIGANMEYPATFFYDNLMMGVQLIHQAHLHKVEKFVTISTICAYPKYTHVPFKEENFWDGYPEETNAPYGLAKKMLLVQSQAYRKQYGFNSIYLLQVNLYGPGDNFDPKSSHVIPALIKKCFDAKDKGNKEIVIWGDGSPTREFLYVKDAARAIVAATESYDKSEPVNIGAGFEISIKELAELIVEMTEFKGKIVWDKSKPNGQPRRCLDVSKAEKEFGFKAKTDFKDGLRETIEWYKANGSNLKGEVSK